MSLSLRACHGRARRHGRVADAFTLVELLVVIGIIAILVAILLPALNKARDRANTAACQSNLRQMLVAAYSYAADNKGSMPWGFVFNQQKDNGRPLNGTRDAVDHITFFSVLDHYMGSKNGLIVPYNVSLSIYYDGATARKFSQALKCPAAPPGFNEMVHYYFHGVAMPVMPTELGMSDAEIALAGPKIQGPAKTSQLYPDNALFWDTALWHEAEATVPSLFWSNDNHAHASGGFNLPCATIDKYFSSVKSGISYPAYPELRYRGPSGDRFAGSTNPLKNPGGPIAWLSDEYLQANGADAGPTANVDPAAGGMYYVAFGGPRWRHNGNQYCNVAFADGSVRSLLLTKKRFKVGGVEFYDNEFRRTMLMLRWPNNKRDSGVISTN
jgi:prepilin-type processing-associated H-X9-DG protein/prepilin-type N-terminal cleavage/methylation domain-containing protein